MSGSPQRPPGKQTRKRADVLLVERGLVESREQAQALIMAGAVLSPTGLVQKAGAFLDPDTPLELRERLPYVSRGGVKLAHALDTWAQPHGICLDGITALDVGASTGGFTDCLLQRGAACVYAVDVGHGQLHYRLRQDPRVTCMEKVNVRYPFTLPEVVDLLVADVSFISLTMALPEPLAHLKPAGTPSRWSSPSSRRGVARSAGAASSETTLSETTSSPGSSNGSTPGTTSRSLIPPRRQLRGTPETASS